MGPPGERTRNLAERWGGEVVRREEARGARLDARGVSGGQLAMPAGHRRAGVVGASRLHSPPA